MPLDRKGQLVRLALLAHRGQWEQQAHKARKDRQDQPERLDLLGR
jgi:hypothetical protein